MSQPIDVYAWWHGSVWQYSYELPCPHCRRRHMHGGGSGEQPDLAIGQTGSWITHCVKPNADRDITLRLVRIVSRREAAGS